MNRAGVEKKKLEDHAWFAGFATVEDPRLVVVVFVENGGHGGSAAAPLAQQIFAKFFNKTLPQPPAQRTAFTGNGKRKTEDEQHANLTVDRSPFPVSRLPQGSSR